MHGCAVEADLNRYMQEQEAADAYGEAVDAEIEELMAPGAQYDPFTPSALVEALTETLNGQDETLSTALSRLLATGNNAGLHMALADAAIEYWKPYAENKAIALLKDRQANECGRCRGRGCNRCEPDY